MINEADTDGNGEVDFNEFLGLMTRKINEGNEEEEMMDAFSIFDRNGDGFISAKEIKLVLKYLGEEPDEEEINGMIKEADRDCDGLISYRDFRDMMINQ